MFFSGGPSRGTQARPNAGTAGPAPRIQAAVAIRVRRTGRGILLVERDEGTETRYTPGSPPDPAFRPDLECPPGVPSARRRLTVARPGDREWILLVDREGARRVNCPS